MSLNIMEGGTVTKVINDFLTLAEDEISLKKGDIVQVLEKVDRHWWYGCCGGKYGKFPASYLISLDVPPLEESHELFAALADFPRQQDGDLSFAKGELIVGISPVNEDWWYGKIDTRTGIFPTTYTWQLDSKPLKLKLKPSMLNMKARVKMNMKAQLPEEMDLHKGDILVVTEVIDKNWYRGICGTQQGIFPSSYVEVLEDSVSIGDNGAAVCSQFAFPDQSPETSSSASRVKCNNDVDSLLALSPEKQFPPQALTIDVPTVTDADIFDDDYFKVNMPSIYRSESVNKRSDECVSNTSGYKNESELSCNTQSLVELDIVPYGITLYPFYAQFDNELSFHEGEIVTLCRHIDKDWIEGVIEGKKGIFPKSYVNILVDCQNCTSVKRDSSYYSFSESEFSHFSETELTPDVFAKVLYNFDAQMNGDLTVHKGEVVRIVSKANEDWCEVRNQFGKVGLCPQNYLTTHLLTSEGKNKLLRGTSLGADNLLGLFSSNEESSNINIVDTQNDWNKRKYESCDFSQTGNLSTQKKSSIEDLMAKNIESYRVKSKTSSPLPNQRYSVDLSINRSPDFILGSSDSSSSRERSSVSPKLRREDSPVGFEQHRITPEPEQQLPPSPPRVSSVQHPKDDRGSSPLENDRASTEDEGVELRHRAEEKLHVNRSHFRRQELSRHSSDRLPHRPAPPVPVPGQKPVRRSIHREQTTATSDKTIIEEKSPSPEEQAEGGNMRGENSLHIFEEQRKKNAEQRQNVISELVFTEKEYVRDLKITYETFNLYNPRHLEERGIDVKTVFGNILEVMHVAEELLDKLQLAMKGKNEEAQTVGPCFLELAEQMKCVYGQYCMNHNSALVLLEKYESNEDIQNLFKKGIETLRYQVACFDMGSILIKPVQRILKYPLILNELIKFTEDSHKDKPHLLNAVKTMMEVATYINEYKRRQDIVTKYLDDGNTTISSRMSRISLHSVAKKSTRLGVMLTSTLFGVATKDPVFDEHEFMFHTVEKTTRNFVKDVEIFLVGMNEKMNNQLHIGAAIVNFYQESNSEAEEFHKLQQFICKRFWVEFRKTVEQRVLVPLNTLIDLFEGPAILVQKRHDKLLDYDGCFAKAEKNKENRMIQEELLATKSNYEALNSHLLEELPTLNSLASDVLVECLAAFIRARKILSGKITKEYLALMETPLMKSCQGDAIESFAVKHSLVWNQLIRCSFSPKTGKTDTLKKKSAKLSPSSTPKQQSSESLNRVSQNQSPSQQAYLQSRYPQDVLFYTVHPYVASESLELTVDAGHIVAVIKKHNPLGDSNMWFVDDGTTKGFVPSSCLESLYRSTHSASPTNVPSHSPRLVPSPDHMHKSDHRMSKPKPDATTCTPPSRSSEPPPPSYDEVVSSADSSPYLETLRVPASLDHEYQEIGDNESGHNLYEEIPEPDNGSMRHENISSSDGSSTRGFVYAMYDFAGGGMNMLSMKSGQVLFVLQQQDCQGNPEWWLVEDRFGKKGYVPGNFLRKYEQ